MSKWSNKTLNDRFVRDAKRLKYASRAAFKLIAIQKKHSVIRKGIGRASLCLSLLEGSTVLDLGCAPGSWLQVACKELGPKRNGGVIVGIDIQAIKQTVEDPFTGDIRSMSVDRLMEWAPKVDRFYSLDGGWMQGFDVVLSDMLPFTSGNALLDVQRSLELTEAAVALSIGPRSDAQDASHRGVLKEGGHLVMKIFEGAGTNAFVKDTGEYFRTVSRMRPEAVRKASREFYLICKGLKKMTR